MNDVREALKTDDQEKIESATAALTTASQKLGEKMYADAQAAAAAGGAAGAAGAAGLRVASSPAAKTRREASRPKTSWMRSSRK